MGFLMGLLVGAIAALLYTPRSGDEIREELRLRSDELRRRADDLQRVAQRLAGEAQQKGRELADDAKREWTAASGPGGTPPGGTMGGSMGGTTGSGSTTGGPRSSI